MLFGNNDCSYGLSALLWFSDFWQDANEQKLYPIIRETCSRWMDSNNNGHACVQMYTRD